VSRRPRVTEFVDPRSGELRALLNANGPPTSHQLVALHRAGALALTEPGYGESFTKAEAAYAVDRAIERGLLVPRRPVDPAERFDRVCRAIVEHVRADPGCSSSSVERAVPGNRAYTGARIRDLLELEALVDRGRRRGPGRALWLNDAADQAAGRSTA
jgi:hypothetical protein